MYFYFLSFVLKIFSKCRRYMRRTWGPWEPGLKIWRLFSCFMKNNFSFTTVFVVCWLCAWAHFDTWKLYNFAVVIVLGTSGRLGNLCFVLGCPWAESVEWRTQLLSFEHKTVIVSKYCSFGLFWSFFSLMGTKPSFLQIFSILPNKSILL